MTVTDVMQTVKEFDCMTLDSTKAQGKDDHYLASCILVPSTPSPLSVASPPWQTLSLISRWPRLQPS
jgi:hypothetical protein